MALLHRAIAASAIVMTRHMISAGGGHWARLGAPDRGNRMTKSRCARFVLTIAVATLTAWNPPVCRHRT